MPIQENDGIIQLIGKYQLGRLLGRGNFGKVKFAKNIQTGNSYAVKILDKNKIVNLKITAQIKREIGTLKLLRHPNIVRLYEILGSKTKIYMVLEYVNGGELFDKLASQGKLPENKGRKLFQQLIDGVSYCHDKGVYHRDLKLENILIDGKGNIKVSDFGLSALPQHFGSDGLLHTTCGSPNYVAPEVLANRGYNGATADVWSCGVILYVILTGYLPFDDRNLAVLYQKIARGDVQIPKSLSCGAKRIIKRILDPNPKARITISEIKADEWFREGYLPSKPDNDDDDEDKVDFEKASLINEVHSDGEKCPSFPTLNNAFQLIGMSSFLDLSGFFEHEGMPERKIRFTSNLSRSELLQRIQNIVTGMGFHVHSKYGKLRVVQEQNGEGSTRSLSVTAEVLEISPSLYVVEVRKLFGDSSVYQQLCKRLSTDIGAGKGQDLLSLNQPLSTTETPAKVS